MKTSKSILSAQQIKFIGLLISSVLMLTFSGCQKDESARPEAQQINKDQMKRADLVSQTFSALDIEHSAGNTFLPDYKVSVKSTGNVTFIGIRNVAFIGRAEYKVSPEIISEMNDLINHSNFFTMRDEISWVPDLPINTTTYISAQRTDFFKTLHDRELKPAELVSLRQKLEGLLQISKYIINTRTIVLTSSGKAED